MATRTRDSAPGREKRGTSPSHVPQKATKSSSPARTKNDSEKHIPNYLKATISSSRDASNSKEQGKKPVTSTTNITRRRSLDNTPSPSRTQKTRVSPNPTLRSSGKNVTSQKPVHDKNLKPTKGTTLYARPVGSAKNSTVKKQTSTTSTTKEQITSPPEELGAPVTPPEPETQVEDQESPITAQDVIDDEKNMILEDEAPINNEQSQVESENDANIESPKVLEPEDVSLGVNTEEKSPTEEQEQENISNEINSIANNDTNEEVQDEAIVMDNKEGDQVVAIESETGEMNETEVQEVDDEMEKKVTEAPKQVILTAGKKDSAVSNDVIEETASKLREHRKNKVKALAGAFETVISQQDPSNNNS
ncbi:hypothetical protein ACJIZ3_004319 [Penstemon smallii]|uniref:Calmodulin-binding domain-containing protein n=1 Tax=Penstemon smallii TaxID=265156 RepID=A0ABD3S1Q6_9LAMI